jgi:hypothetical protein
MIDFFEKYQGATYAILHHLHALITSLPGVEGRLTYNLPFYYRNTWICYLAPQKDGSVEVGFTRGNELSNEQGLLDARGRKLVWSVVFRHVSEIPEETLLEVLQEALLVDEFHRQNKKKKKN